MTATLRLNVLTGYSAGQQLTLTAAGGTVGREADATARIRDPEVPEQWLRIAHRPDSGWWLEWVGELALGRLDGKRLPGQSFLLPAKGVLQRGPIRLGFDGGNRDVSEKQAAAATDVPQTVVMPIATGARAATSIDATVDLILEPNSIRSEPTPAPIHLVTAMPGELALRLPLEPTTPAVIQSPLPGHLSAPRIPSDVSFSSGERYVLQQARVYTDALGHGLERLIRAAHAGHSSAQLCVQAEKLSVPLADLRALLEGLMFKT